MDDTERLLTQFPELRPLKTLELKRAWEQLLVAEDAGDQAARAKRHAISTLLFRRPRS